MERFPNHEENELNEKIEKTTVLDAIRSKGFDDPTVEQLIEKWVEQKEKTLENESLLSQVIFDCEKVDLFLAASDTEGALDHLNETLYQLEQNSESFEQNMELHHQIMNRMKEIKNTYQK